MAWEDTIRQIGNGEVTTLRHNSAVTESQLGELATALKSESCKLQLFDFSYGYIGDLKMPIFTTFTEALAANTSLTDINLACNGIDSTNMARITRALIKNKTLKKINLSHNSIRETEDLIELLNFNTTLLKINLSNNNIRGKRLEALCSALVNNTSLTALNITENLIGDDGIKSLSKVIVSNNTLLFLSFRQNRITDVGVSAIAEALKHNSSLVFIEASMNNIGEAGINALSEALENNYTVLYFKHNNEAGDPEDSRLNKLVNRNIKAFSKLIDDIDSGKLPLSDIKPQDLARLNTQLTVVLTAIGEIKLENRDKCKYVKKQINLRLHQMLEVDLQASQISTSSSGSSASSAPSSEQNSPETLATRLPTFVDKLEQQSNGEVKFEKGLF